MNSTIETLDNETMTIDWDSIDKNDLKQSLINLRRGGYKGKIEVLFDKNGKFTGHRWGYNCSYSIDDLRANKDYRLNEYDEVLLGEFMNNLRGVN